MRAATFVLVSVFALGLAGCGNPGFMPAGYAYHQNDYKAAPGPEAKNLGYEYSIEKNQEILDAWHIAISDLFSNLEKQAGLVPGAVYIEPSSPQNAFDASFDEALRAEMIARGYALAEVSESLPRIRYEASIAKSEEHLEGRRAFLLSLTILDAADKPAVLGQASGVYDLPDYGYGKAPMPGHLYKPVFGGERE